MWILYNLSSCQPPPNTLCFKPSSCSPSLAFTYIMWRCARAIHQWTVLLVNVYCTPAPRTFPVRLACTGVACLVEGLSANCWQTVTSIDVRYWCPFFISSPLSGPQVNGDHSFPNSPSYPLKGELVENQAQAFFTTSVNTETKSVHSGWKYNYTQNLFYTFMKAYDL